MPSLDEIVERCRAALADPAEVKPALDLAEQLAWNDAEGYERLAEAERRALDDFTEDMDLFEQDPAARRDAPDLLGPENVGARIELFLSRVGDRGTV